MEFQARSIDIGTQHPTVLLTREDAEELGANPLDRVHLRWGEQSAVGIVEVSDELVEPGTIGVTPRLGAVDGTVSVTLAGRPRSVQHVRKKLDDLELDPDEVRGIIRDIQEDRLSDMELSAYVSAIYANGLSLAETRALAKAMTETGQRLSWEAPVVADKHSIGGVAGNRVTPIVVAIVAAAGVPIPKTSSRAVTSPAGTADTMEVFCEVDLSIAEIRAVVDEVGGCVVWGGSVDLSPVDDKIIRAENPLSLDPPGQVIASVLSKKHSAGSTHVVIDVPYGEGAKVESLGAARELAEDFIRVGEELGMTIECAITRGDAPIGRGVGPVLEARDVLAVLDGDGPDDLRRKAVRLAAILIEETGIDADAERILESGEALERFRRLLGAQGGDPGVEVEDLQPGEHTHVVAADADGLVTHVDNRLVSDVARRAGAPRDAAAGLRLHHRPDDRVVDGDPLYTIYAEKESKLADATDRAREVEVVRVRSSDEALVERV
ncbi:MAG: AMP phosphorylase [Halobacteriales archaeon]